MNDKPLNADAQKVKDLMIELIKNKASKTEIGLCLEYSRNMGDSTATTHIIITKNHKVFFASVYDYSPKLVITTLETLGMSYLSDFIEDDNCGIANLTFLEMYEDFQPNIRPKIEAELLGTGLKKKNRKVLQVKL